MEDKKAMSVTRRRMMMIEMNLRSERSDVPRAVLQHLQMVVGMGKLGGNFRSAFHRAHMELGVSWE
jgi:hypothetical protein